MPRITDLLTPGRTRPVFVCDFSPPRGADPALIADAALLSDADFVCVAYNPGKAVRVDSVACAQEVRRITGRDAVFNLSPRDMNKLALESRLLGAELVGLQNVLVVQGDPITERDNLTAVKELTASGLISAIRDLNAGTDFKGLKLRSPCHFCIGGSIDLGRGVALEARLTHRKVLAGADYFVTQPIFDVAAAREFHAAYEEVAGAPLQQPVFWGLQVLVAGGVLFSNVPDPLRHDLEAGRDGLDIARETYSHFAGAGIDTIYLVAPILRGGARDYAAAGALLHAVNHV